MRREPLNWRAALTIPTSAGEIDVLPFPKVKPGQIVHLTWAAYSEPEAGNLNVWVSIRNGDARYPIGFISNEADSPGRGLQLDVCLFEEDQLEYEFTNSGGGVLILFYAAGWILTEGPDVIEVVAATGGTP